MNKLTTLRQHITPILFTVDRSEPIVRYNVRPGYEDIAKKTWAVHGICMSCRSWAISTGRCLQCDKMQEGSALKGIHAENMVEAQIKLAKTLDKAK